nr:hypothetical protein [Candidatus Sigynarchaeota archaeon]
MSTVRLDEKHSKMLDELKAKLTLQGKKISKQEIVGRIIEIASNNNEILLDEQPQAANDVDELKIFDWGISDTSTTVDQHLYGIKRSKNDT